MNYKQLLIKFMQYTIDIDTKGSSTVTFTAEETTALEQCFEATNHPKVH